MNKSQIFNNYYHRTYVSISLEKNDLSLMCYRDDNIGYSI